MAILGHPRYTKDIDIWILTSRENRVLADEDGLVFPVISLRDLRSNKSALGHHQELADLDQLDEE
ncbi:MAG: hypothetical protein ACFHXK_08100 [bacterium]